LETPTSPLIFDSYDVVLEQIKKLRVQGYDRIHLPGGTSKDGVHYAGGIVAVYDHLSKKVYFVGVPYNSSFHKGNENGHNKKLGENPEQTFVRELMEETALQTKLSDLNLIFYREKPDNRPGMEGKLHYQYFYLVEDFTGNFWTFDGPNPIDGETAAPLFIPADLFVEVIFKGHLAAVKKAIEEMINEKEDYYWALKDLPR
jgi:ADP-ribose pyrophosphatase YjhB (NUDIX family)